MNAGGDRRAGDGAVTVVGCGYTGRRLLHLCRLAGRDASATARSEEIVAELRGDGFPADLLDLDIPGELLPDVWTQDRALICMVPPPETATDDPRMRAFLRRLAGMPRTLVYLSTTGVYGDAGGAEVDEETPPRPTSDRGRRRLDAEEAVLGWGDASGVPVRVLRVPGIYGPGRLPLRQIRQGAPVARAQEAGPGNRIHVDDLAAVCLVAADYEGPERIFNVGDGDHASRSVFYREVARQAGLAEPPEVSMEEVLAQASPAMRGFLAESRRVATRRMRTVLGFQPRYQDLTHGIAASLAEGD
jgi:nucleoside-diphosphate-sugar epimerase